MRPEHNVSFSSIHPVNVVEWETLNLTKNVNKKMNHKLRVQRSRSESTVLIVNIKATVKAETTSACKLNHLTPPRCY